MRDDNNDLLFGLLREAMLSQDILSSFYRSHITALDDLGLSHKITIDIAPQYAKSPELLTHLEGKIFERASRLAEIKTVFVYWRADSSLEQVQPALHIRQQAARPPGAL